jgi:hypothetical protein
VHGVLLIWRQLLGKRFGRWLLLLAGATVLLGTVRSARRAHDWMDEEALFGAAVLAQPRSARAHYNLGSALLLKGDYVTASTVRAGSGTCDLTYRPYMLASR